MFGCASDILNFTYETNSHDQIDGRLVFLIVILRFRGFWEAQYSCSKEMEALHQNLTFMTKTFLMMFYI
jgi:hypothetical protein